MKTFKKLKKGFTLVELVVVIAVIAILAAVSVGAYFGVTESANNSKLEQEAKQVHTAIQTVALVGDEHSSLDSSGLNIKLAGEFEAALEANLGKDVALIDEQGKSDPNLPTICFYVDTQVSNQIGDGTKYTNFEYHIPGLNHKNASVDVVTGDCSIVTANSTQEEIKPLPITVSLEEANEIGETLENNKYTKEEYIVNGQITNIEEDYFGNMYIASGDETFYIYGLLSGETQYGDLENKPEVGDNIKVCGAIGNYQGTAQMKAAQLVSFTKGELPPVEPIEITLEDANEIGEAAETPTREVYIVEGTISEVSDPLKGQFKISNGNTTLVIFKCFQIIEGTKTDYADLAIQPNYGDFVVLKGSLSNYKGVAQIQNAEIVEITDNEIPAITSIPEALEAPDGAPVSIRGTVVSIDNPYSSEYNNISVTVADEAGNTISAYRTVGNAELYDIVEIAGLMSTYNSKRQIAEKSTLVNTDEKHLCSNYLEADCFNPEKCVVCGAEKTGSQPADCVDGDSNGKCDNCGLNMNEELATITFNDKAKRTEYSAEKQVWTENGITVTNNKATSTSNVGDYFNPARFYKNSEIIISFPSSEVKEIVFKTAVNSSGDVKEDQFFTWFGTCLSEELEVTNNGSDTYTVTNYNDSTLTIIASAGQLRLYSISVVYVPGEVTPEPDEPVEPEVHTHTFENGGATCDDPTCNEPNPDYNPQPVEGWNLVTDASTLSLGDKIIIASADNTKALAEDRGNNRGATSIVVENNQISNIGSAQVIVLEEGTGADTFAFKVDTGYLYAASSTSNHLKTKSSIDVDGSWNISIENDAATIKATGSTNRNRLRYNGSNNLFSCYASGQSDVSIYRNNNYVIEEPYLDDFTLNNESLTLAVGEEATIKVSSAIDQRGNPFDISSLEITYASNDTSIVTISDNGVVHAVAEGETTISVTISGIIRTVSINVTEDTSGDENEIESEISVFANMGKVDGDIIYWENENFRLTNKKGATDFRTSDSDHYRVYQGSKLELTLNGTHTQIREVKFTCTTAAYATALKNSMNDTNFNVSVSDNVVTIKIKSGLNANTLTFSATAQTRIKNVSATVC